MIDLVIISVQLMALTVKAEVIKLIEANYAKNGKKLGKNGKNGKNGKKMTKNANI